MRNWNTRNQNTNLVVRNELSESYTYMMIRVNQFNLIKNIFRVDEALQQLQFKLELETAKEEQLESDLSFAEKVLIKIQSSFKHFTEVLQQIGEDYDDQVDVEAYGESELSNFTIKWNHNFMSFNSRDSRSNCLTSLQRSHGHFEWKSYEKRNSNI